MDGNSDMRMMRQAALQTWIDAGVARKAHRRREQAAMLFACLVCLLVVTYHLVNPIPGSW